MNTSNLSADRWRRIVRQQRASGLSVAAYCRRAGVPQSSFYAWQRKLRDEATFAEVKLSPGMTSTASGMTAVRAGAIELCLAGRRRVVVRPGFDRQTLLDLLHLLETRSSDLLTGEAEA